jgi:hypothetical protein
MFISLEQRFEMNRSVTLLGIAIAFTGLGGSKCECDYYGGAK